MAPASIVSSTVSYEAGGVSTHTYKANVTEEITGQIDRNSSMDMNFKSDTKITMTAPEVVIDSPNFTQTDASKASVWAGVSFKGTGANFFLDGMKMGAIGAQVAVYGVKAEYSGFKFDVASIVYKKEVNKFGDFVAAIQLGMFKTAIRGLYVAI